MSLGKGFLGWLWCSRESGWTSNTSKPQAPPSGQPLAPCSFFAHCSSGRFLGGSRVSLSHTLPQQKRNSTERELGPEI